ILTEKLARRGQHIAREYSVDLFEIARVGETMERNPPVIPAETSLDEFSARLASGDEAPSRRQAALLTDADGRLAGIIARGDVFRAERTQLGLTVLEAGTADAVTAFPDETLRDAIARMLERDVGRLAVVAREDPRRIVGYLGRADILKVRNRHRE